MPALLHAYGVGQPIRRQWQLSEAL